MLCVQRIDKYPHHGNHVCMFLFLLTHCGDVHSALCRPCLEVSYIEGGEHHRFDSSISCVFCLYEVRTSVPVTRT